MQSQGNKKAMKINASSPFSLCSLNGSDGHGTLGGYVIFGRKTEYRGVIETVIVLKQAA
jgi:hypothetical protein